MDDLERIQNIQLGYWIEYNKAREILNHMEYLFNHVQTHRMPNMLLVGKTNSGKTAVLRKFVSMHKSFYEEGEDRTKVEVLMIQAPPSPDEKRFYNTILEKLFIPTSPQVNIARRQQDVIDLLKDIGTKVLIIDEIQHLSTGGTYRKQRQFLNVLKYLSNELKISIIGAGTEEAYNAIQVDPQTSNRFVTYKMPEWSLSKDYFRLLASFEKALPLRKPSNLIDPKIATRIMSMSEGTIGEVFGLLRDASIEAIRSGEERISISILEKLYWTSPSERRNQMA